MGHTAAALYAAVSALAWFSVIPAFGWIYVQIETVFYRRFRAFYDDLEGGAPLRQLRARADSITAETARILRGAGLVQAAVTLVALVAAPLLMRLAGLSSVAVLPFRLAVVGAALQVITLLEILVLYYFDLRRDAFLMSRGAVLRRSGADPGVLGARVAVGDRLHRRLWPHLCRRCRAGAAAIGDPAGRHVSVTAVRRPTLRRLCDFDRQARRREFPRAFAYSFRGERIHCFWLDNCWIREGKFVPNLLRSTRSRSVQTINRSDFLKPNSKEIRRGRGNRWWQRRGRWEWLGAGAAVALGDWKRRRSAGPTSGRSGCSRASWSSSRRGGGGAERCGWRSRARAWR